jgi:hypothetical protein
MRPEYKWKLMGEAWEGREQRIWTFSSLDGGPDDGPPFGTMLCGQPGMDGQDLLASSDYLLYLDPPGQWKEVDLAGLFDHLTFRIADIKAFRITRQLDNNKAFRDRFAEFINEVRGR